MMRRISFFWGGDGAHAPGAGIKRERETELNATHKNTHALYFHLGLLNENALSTSHDQVAHIRGWFDF